MTESAVRGTNRFTPEIYNAVGEGESGLYMGNTIGHSSGYYSDATKDSFQEFLYNFDYRVVLQKTINVCKEFFILIERSSGSQMRICKIDTESGGVWVKWIRDIQIFRQPDEKEVILNLDDEDVEYASDCCCVCKHNDSFYLFYQYERETLDRKFTYDDVTVVFPQTRFDLRISVLEKIPDGEGYKENRAKERSFLIPGTLEDYQFQKNQVFIKTTQGLFLADLNLNPLEIKSVIDSCRIFRAIDNQLFVSNSEGLWLIDLETSSERKLAPQCDDFTVESEDGFIRGRGCATVVKGDRVFIKSRGVLSMLTLCTGESRELASTCDNFTIDGDRVFVEYQGILSMLSLNSMRSRLINYGEKYLSLQTQVTPASDIVLPEIAFGRTKWQEIFRVDVGVEPPLPDDIDEILERHSVLFQGMGEVSSLLLLIPETVNGSPLTINSFGAKIIEDLRNMPEGKSHWVLITNQLIPHSLKKSYEALEHRLSELGPYDFPPALDALIASYLSGNNEKKGTYCQELVGGYSKPAVVWPPAEGKSPVVEGLRLHDKVDVGTKAWRSLADL